MEHLFFPDENPEFPSREETQAQILAQRFEGRCSIDAISTLLKRLGMPFSSNEGESVELIVFSDDEIFARAVPILITVDPVSSAILRIERVKSRTAKAWSGHFQSLLDHGFSPRLTTSDAGTALCAAHKKTLVGIPWQLDTFHGIAHRLGGWNRRLEKAAYAAIHNAEERAAKLESAHSDKVIDKRLQSCLEADQKADKAVDLYADFNYLYKVLIHQLNTFDSVGQLREHDEAEEEMRAALDLMELLHHRAIHKEVESIKKALPDLLTYFEDAQVAVENCQKLSTNKEALTCLYLAWQWNKAVIKSKEASRKRKATEQRQFYLDLAKLLIEDEKVYLELWGKVEAELEQIIQASSIVECINSILRPYLNNAKNQVTQEFLNTFMFYHNHRRYHAGKRKGKTPMEMLTGREQKEDWITLMLKEVGEQEESALAS